MDFLKSILSRLGIWIRPQPRPNALEFSSLNKVPVDLLLRITGLLPLDSASAFSLCCRPIYFALGTRYREDLKHNSLDWYEFLTNFERDLPSYVICYHCRKFHTIAKAHRHVHSEGFRCSLPGLPCWRADYNELTWAYLHEEFSSTIFQMTMKLYRLGLEYSDLLGLLSLKTRTHFRTGYVEQRTALAKIVDGNLLLREQKVFMLPTTQTIPLELDDSFNICPHVEFLWPEDFDRYLAGIDISHCARYRSQFKEMFKKCKYCLSEFRIDFKQFGEHGNAMYVTRWLDLGRGPREDKYQSHVCSRKGRSWRPWSFEKGSVFAAFEEKEHSDFDYDTLTEPKDMQKLIKKSIS